MASHSQRVHDVAERQPLPVQLVGQPAGRGVQLAASSGGELESDDLRPGGGWIAGPGSGGRAMAGGAVSTTAALVPPRPIELTSTCRSSSVLRPAVVGT